MIFFLFIFFILDHIPIIYLSIYITCTFLNKILWSQRYIIKPKFSHILWFFVIRPELIKKKGVPIYTWFPGPRGLKWCFSLGANSTDTNRLNIVYKGENESLEKILCIDNTSYFNLIPSKNAKVINKNKHILYRSHLCLKINAMPFAPRW